MDASLLGLLWSLLEKVGLAFLLVFALAQTKYLRDLVAGRLTVVNGAVVVVFFGGLSVLGTSTGVPYSGAIINIRDTAPMIAGLVGGPFVGLAVGLIGGIHRYTVGGATAVPCAITTILAGLLAGLIYNRAGKKVVGARWATLFAIGIMAIEMGLIVLLVQPLDKALGIVQVIALPMFVANAIGTGSIVFIMRGARRDSEISEPAMAVAN